MSPASWHAETLPMEQRLVLSKLGPAATARGFYLAGGTAVAIRIGHRRSIDFDWFTSAALADPLGLASELAASGIPVVVSSSPPETLHAAIDDVRCSFLSYRYPLLAPLERWNDFGIDVASPEDLACMKLAAISQRGARRDFVDLDALIESGLDLASLLGAYRRKFGVRDSGHLLAALAYYDDAEKEPEPDLLKPSRWDDVKTRFAARIRAAAR